MRTATTLLAALNLIACTTASQTSDQLPERCPTTDCFSTNQARDFEVIDPTTLVLYVGSQDCPFLVEFSGPACDLTFIGSTTLTFRSDTLREEFQTDMRIARICARDIGIGVEQDPFSPDPGLPGTTLACHIRDVTSITDDELLELYVDRGLTPPPPPVGTGQITVPEQEAGERTGEAEGQGATPNGDPAETDVPPETNQAAPEDE